MVTDPRLRLLLLSATPTLHSDEVGFQALLHLLDPVVYPLGDLAGFRTRLARHETVAQLSSQPPMRQACAAEHGAGSQRSSTHSRTETSQISPVRQPRPRQVSSTQRPSRGSHTVGSVHTTPSHANVQLFMRQTHAGMSGSSGAHWVTPSTSIVSSAHSPSWQRGAMQKQPSAKSIGMRPAGQRPNSLSLHGSAHAQSMH